MNNEYIWDWIQDHYDTENMSEAEIDKAVEKANDYFESKYQDAYERFKEGDFNQDGE